MFRVSQCLHALRDPAPLAPPRRPVAPVVIWNLIRRCNLACRHCYTVSADVDFSGELSTDEALAVIEDLAAMRVPMLILSGGEPLLRPDLGTLARAARARGLHLGLSTNGTLLTEANIDEVVAMGFEYVGISLDGLRVTHDRFRRLEGAFERSLAAVRLCQRAGLKVGLRCTLTQDNSAELPALIQLARDEGVAKFYLSHWNSSGRGARNLREDAVHAQTRAAMQQVFQAAWDDLGRIEYVTGNNDADGPFLLDWAGARGLDTAKLRSLLERWGGNATGVNIANIDNLGEVHPDSFWGTYSLGNVRLAPFSRIWRDTQDPLMLGLRARPRPLEGRCGACRHLAICNGNTRVRAWAATGNPWAEDPGCYLTDAEIGLAAAPATPRPAPRPSVPVVRRQGVVWLVGAGPGDPDLLTVKAARLIAEADVIVYDRLVSAGVLALARPGVKRLYVGKSDGLHTLAQEDINRLLVRLARRGHKVLRLKGGDPMIFGRGGEELEAVLAAGLPVEVVPGITAAAGAASYAGIPLTHRDCAHGVSFVTGHLRDGALVDLDWAALARPWHTVVFYMGLHGLGAIVAALLAHGRDPATPAALLERGTLPDARVHAGTLADLPQLAEACGAQPPTLVIVGEVVALRERLDWHTPQPALADAAAAAG